MVTCSNINKEHYNELQKQVKEEGKVARFHQHKVQKTHNTKEHNYLGMQILIVKLLKKKQGYYGIKLRQ